MRKKLIAGNWKMNGSCDSVNTLLTGLCAFDLPANVDYAVFPPFVFLPQAAERLQGSMIGLGAQNVCDHAAGAVTGEVSAEMLRAFGCQYAIVGHSERRQLYRESNELVAARFHRAASAGLLPILCVGETLVEREGNKTLAIIKEQLAAVLTIEDNPLALVAYEPVWAIGTGKTASPEQAEEVHQFIREMVAAHNAEMAQQLRILYGGSVKPENAAGLLSMSNIDGALVGGASLEAHSFIEIGRVCQP